MVEDKTLIRGNKVCKNVIGHDANALYLWAIIQGMPVGKYKHITEYNVNNLIHDVFSQVLLSNISKAHGQFTSVLFEVHRAYFSNISSITLQSAFESNKASWLST